MCGRFNLLATPGVDELLEVLGVDAQLGDRVNIAPTEAVAIIIEPRQDEVGLYGQTGKRQCHMARWWLTPSWSSGPDTRFAMFNARAETLHTSRAYKGPFRHKRCLIPATSFVEWRQQEGGKQPIEVFAPKQPLIFAGLWDCWNDELLSCTIITTEATPAMRDIHKRMPVMLGSDEMKQWLNPEASTDELKPLLASHLPYALRARPINKRYSNSRDKTLPEAVGESWEISE
jgi:putative SOS response-associated peptidase YedK